MKNLFALLFVAGLVSFASCQKAAEQAENTDSVAVEAPVEAPVETPAVDTAAVVDSAAVDTASAQ